MKNKNTEEKIKDFLFNEFDNITKFYSDRETFEKHFYSGEVKIPAPFVLDLIKKFFNENSNVEGESKHTY